MSFKTRYLGDVVEFIRGITFKPDDVVLPEQSGAVVCMRTKNIQEELDESDLIAVPQEFVKRDDLYLQEGDVLISSANSWNLVGKVAMVPALPYKATAGGFIAIVRAKPGKADPRFLYHWLASEKSQAAIRACGRQTTNISNLSIPQFLALAIAIPDLREQQRIVAILDKADSLRRKRQEAIRLADDFLQASYLELANRQNDRITIDSVLADIPNAARTGPFGSQMLVSEFQESGIPVLGIDNVVQNRFCWGAKRFISEAKYKELERYTVRPGDVMVTIMGTTGRVAIAPEDIPICISTKHLCTLTLDRSKMLPEYLWACLRWDLEVKAQTQREAKGAIMEGWNMGIVKALEVRRPSLDEQQFFVNKVHALRRLQSRTEKSLVLTDDLIGSLTNRFFTQ
ncbi:restriction endonuclease subunit S [Leptothrix ochracea]|uniref:restriction endonuclease subunit S n=1 Tax=Leptothrix ochracea TaxID=735331 RepID=UPI0034E2A357